MVYLGTISNISLSDLLGIQIEWEWSLCSVFVYERNWGLIFHWWMERREFLCVPYVLWLFWCCGGLEENGLCLRPSGNICKFWNGVMNIYIFNICKKFVVLDLYGVIKYDLCIGCFIYGSQIAKYMNRVFRYSPNNVEVFVRKRSYQKRTFSLREL